MTYSNDIFSFFIYKFDDKLNFNSIQLVAQKHFVLVNQEYSLFGSETIDSSDIDSLLLNIQVQPSKTEIPFPQADKFDRVIDLLNLLSEKDLTKEEITEKYKFTGRQADYYTTAGIYFGLITKSYVSNRKPVFHLTDKATNILRNSHRQKTMSLIKIILQDRSFNEAYKLLEKGNIPSTPDVISILESNNVKQKESVMKRRSQTVISWLTWILKQIE